MKTALLVIAIWFVVSIPVALLMGRVLAARSRQYPEAIRQRVNTIKELDEQEQPMSTRYRVEPVEPSGRRRRQWKVVDSQRGRTVWPGGELDQAHRYAGRLNREHDEESKNYNPSRVNRWKRR